MAYSPLGTRAIGAIPASSAAMEIWAQASSDMTPCSISRNSQSKPATAIALAISTLRVIRTPTPSDSWVARPDCRRVRKRLILPSVRRCGVAGGGIESEVSQHFQRHACCPTETSPKLSR
jgi:hypothetical protein